MLNVIDLTPVAEQICQHLGLHYVGQAGEGSFKQNFHVQDANKESFALKVYKPGRFKEERSDREIQAMQRCNHPNIARLFTISSYTTAGHEYFYTTEEFVGGGTLGERLTQQGHISVPTVLTLGQQLIDALCHIASLGLVHRDLKPENILFREGTDTPVIVDFGIVRDLSAESLTGTWLARGPGTPYYAAPEQLNNEKELIDWRTDQFTLGIVLACCAFGDHPYSIDPGSSPVQAVSRRGDRSTRFRQYIQDNHLTVLEKMVNPWPVQRYRTCNDLIAAWVQQG